VFPLIERITKSPQRDEQVGIGAEQFPSREAGVEPPNEPATEDAVPDERCAEEPTLPGVM
jgi:hypothetical protein